MKHHHQPDAIRKNEKLAWPASVLITTAAGVAKLLHAAPAAGVLGRLQTSMLRGLMKALQLRWVAGFCLYLLPKTEKATGEMPAGLGK